VFLLNFQACRSHRDSAEVPRVALGERVSRFDAYGHPRQPVCDTCQRQPHASLDALAEAFGQIKTFGSDADVHG
jgi:hypothetical protein